MQSSGFQVITSSTWQAMGPRQKLRRSMLSILDRHCPYATKLLITEQTSLNETAPIKFFTYFNMGSKFCTAFQLKEQ